MRNLRILFLKMCWVLEIPISDNQKDVVDKINKNGIPLTMPKNTNSAIR